MYSASYSARELAQLLRVSVDCLYRTRLVRERRDALPAPFQLKPMLWDRNSIDAWRLRHHPARAGLPQPANDFAATLSLESDEDQLARFHAAYGGAQ